MKTKSLIAMGAMSALFAACTQDFDEASNVNAGQENRPSAGVVTLNVAEDAATKVWDDDELTQVFQPGERIGAMLMDLWDQEGAGVAHYSQFVDYTHTNYPFTYDGNIWSTPDNAPVSEGNYFFLYPYDPSFHARGYVTFEVPAEQKNVDENGNYNLWQSVKDNQKYLGYSFVDATTEDVNTVNTTLWSIFAAPKFKLLNATPGELKLHKLIIRVPKENGDLELMPNKVALAPLSKEFTKVYTQYPNDPAKQVEYLVENAILVQNGFIAEETNAESGLVSDKENGYYEYTIDFGDNYTTTYNNSFRACAVMPAGNYKTMEVYAFVEKLDGEGGSGFVKFSTLENAKWGKKGDEQGAAEVNLIPNQTQIFSAEFDHETMENLGWHNFTVANSADLAWVLGLKAEFGGNDLVTIKTQGDQVELTQAIYDLLTDPKRNTELQIDGTIVIPEGIPADAIDLLVTSKAENDKASVTAKTTIINRGIQILNENLTADVVNEKTLTEAADKEITIEGNVTNRGTLDVTEITGDLVAEAGSAVVAEVFVLSDVTVAEAAEVTITESVGDVENSGKVTTKGEIRGDMENKVNATWIVNGDLELAGDAANAGTMRVEEGVKVTTTEQASLNNAADGVVENYGTVNKMQNNYGEVNNYETENVVAEITVNMNRNIINNWGVVRIEWGNQGRINMKEKEADVYFLYNLNSESEQNGSIENTVHGNIQNIPNAQHIIYTADGVVAFDDVVKAVATYGKYTDLIIAGNYTLENAEVSPTTVGENNSLKTITINENVTVTVPQNGYAKLGWSTEDKYSVVNEGTIIIGHNATLEGSPITNNGLIRKHNNGNLKNEITDESKGEYVNFDGDPIA